MEQVSNGRLSQTVETVKEKGLSPKVFLFEVGTRRVKLSEHKRSSRECVSQIALKR